MKRVKLISLGLALTAVAMSLACNQAAKKTETVKEKAASKLNATVDGNEYLLAYFQPYNEETIPSEGNTAYKLRFTVLKATDGIATHHANLIYDGKETGCRVRILDIGAKISMGFAPDDLYQIEKNALSEGGAMELIYEIPKGGKPQSIVFYDKSKTKVATIDVEYIPKE